MSGLIFRVMQDCRHWYWIGLDQIWLALPEVCGAVLQLWADNQVFFRWTSRWSCHPSTSHPLLTGGAGPPVSPATEKSDFHNLWHTYVARYLHVPAAAPVEASCHIWTQTVCCRALIMILVVSVADRGSGSRCGPAAGHILWALVVGKHPEV